MTDTAVDAGHKLPSEACSTLACVCLLHRQGQVLKTAAPVTAHGRSAQLTLLKVSPWHRRYSSFVMTCSICQVIR